jgi:hypothetical protein
MNLPMSEKLLKKLFKYLDRQSRRRECNHNFDITREFLRKKNIPQEPVIRWLEENSAFCDCEVIFNVAEKFE